MSITILHRRGTAAQWAAANPVLAAGEPAYETDGAKREKIGDGVLHYNDLPYRPGTIDVLVGLAANPDLLVTGSVVRNASGVVTSAVVAWPDGASGAYTATLDGSGVVSSYAVTHVAGAITLTFTQPPVTRDASGAVSIRPTITVS